MIDSLSRRSVLGLGAAGAALAAAPAFAAQALPAVSLTLIDPDIACSDGRAHTVALEADPVLQWRRGLGARVEASAGGAVAYARWNKAMLINALAREERLQSRLRPAGDNVYEVVITPRPRT